MNNRNIKQVIVIRSDLRNVQGHKIRTGKIIAQACHAAMAFLLKGQFKNTDEVNSWIENGQTKICVSCDSQNELMELYGEAFRAKLNVHIITDAGYTEFKEPTTTCIAIGPNLNTEIDKITGHLKLL